MCDLEFIFVIFDHEFYFIDTNDLCRLYGGNETPQDMLLDLETYCIGGLVDYIDVPAIHAYRIVDITTATQ